MGASEGELAGSWAVYRQDDNGNRFIVRAGLEHEEAIRVASELEARGHKQLYWVQAVSAEVAKRSSRPSEV